MWSFGSRAVLDSGYPWPFCTFLFSLLVSFGDFYINLDGFRLWGPLLVGRHRAVDTAASSKLASCPHLDRDVRLSSVRIRIRSSR